MEYSTEEAEAILARARERDNQARAARKAATPIVWKFTFEPSRRTFEHKVYAAHHRIYELKGEVVNAAEAKAAGHPDHAVRGGGMEYLVCTASYVPCYNPPHVVCAVGGGTIFVGEKWKTFQPGEQIDNSDEVAMHEIDAFLADNPEGGDITDIVMRHRQRRGLK